MRSPIRLALALGALWFPLDAFAQDAPAPAPPAPTEPPPPPAGEPSPVPTEAQPVPPASTATPAVSPTPPPFSAEQQAWIEGRIAEKTRGPRYQLGFDVFMKGLYQNDQSNGSVWLGNPHPEGDNYSGNNGIAGVLGIRIDGRVNERLTAGARLETRFGQQFADFYENGDLAVDENGRPVGVDATGESLGMNHAAYAQLRGLYIQWDRPPVATLKTFRAGSSDLSHWNAFTVGKIRFIDRDNAKGFFLFGELPGGGFEYNVARVALPKLYASAGFNTGIADPFVENPFWARDAVYVAELSTTRERWGGSACASWLLDEEADLDDPDALGSTNVIDERDGVVSTIPRYENVNAILEAYFKPREGWRADLLLGYSKSDPDLGLVFNTIDGNQGLSPIPLADVSGYAVRARLEAANLGKSGVTLRAEYFNIGENWVATMGTRREDDVLWTEGFLDGQLPTLNLANEFIDFTEPFYETIIGWHGVTLKPRWDGERAHLELEVTALGYNTNEQNRCVSKDVVGCEDTGGVYPSFLFPDGMTDTDFFTFANTNDRGRDPRAAYREDQERFTWIGAARFGIALGPKKRGLLEGVFKYIRDEDLRDTSIEEADDYLGNLYTLWARLGWKLGDRASAGVGARGDFWDEAHRSGAIVAGEPRYPDYETKKLKVFVDGRYEFAEGAFLSYRLEWLNKDVDTSDPSLDFAYRNVVRSIAMLYAGF